MPLFIHVCGSSGSGKTTLVRDALQDPEITNLRYLTTFADRPPRPEETLYGSHEYIFVSPEMYDHIRSLVEPCDWDEVEAYGSRKGVDVRYFRDLMHEGANLIVNSYPDVKNIALMRSTYAEAEHRIVFLHTDPELAAARIMGSRPEAERTRITIDQEQAAELERVREISDITVECIGNKERDGIVFRAAIRQLLDES